MLSRSLRFVLFAHEACKVRNFWRTNIIRGYTCWFLLDEIEALIDKLEDNEDVQAVFTNIA